ncbi:hypothetical protein SEA_LIBERTYBELL_39 [Streptomyces phage LibertyBell]|nr:hypothetical protein SEA_LIBERTYBELL_39 [Streptomyces phage LibertyBell]
MASTPVKVTLWGLLLLIIALVAAAWRSVNEND